MNQLLLSTLMDVGSDAGVFKDLMDPSKTLFGNIAYILLEVLGWISIVAIIVSIIVMVVSSERRKLATMVFVGSTLVALLKFGGTLKLFLNNIK